MNSKMINIQYSGELATLINEVVKELKTKKKVLNLQLAPCPLSDDNVIDQLLQLKQRSIDKTDKTLLKAVHKAGSLGIISTPHYYIDDIGCIRYNSGNDKEDYYVASGKDNILYIIKPHLVYVLKDNETDTDVPEQYTFVTSKKFINDDLKVCHQEIKDLLNGGMN